MVKVKINIIYIFLALVNMNLIASDDDSLYFQFEPDLVSLEIGDSINIKVSLLSRDGSLSKNSGRVTPELFSILSCKYIKNSIKISKINTHHAKALTLLLVTLWSGLKDSNFAKWIPIPASTIVNKNEIKCDNLIGKE